MRYDQRVLVLRGDYGSFIHAIGLTYLDLDANTKSRGLLLALEPFLYPTGDYGPLNLSRLLARRPRTSNGEHEPFWTV